MPCELRFGFYANLDARILENTTLYFDEINTDPTITIANETESNEGCESEQVHPLLTIAKNTG
jgi:hypothetical protein